MAIQSITQPAEARGLPELVWAYGRHINRTVENLGAAFRGQGYELRPLSLNVPRWRKLWPIISTLHWDSAGHLRGYSAVHPRVARHYRVPGVWEKVPVMVFGDAILSAAPHFFYQDLNYSTIITHRQAGIRTFMYDDIPLMLLERRAWVEREHYARAAVIFTMSEWVRNKIIRLDGVDPAKVHRVGAGSNLGQSFAENPYGERNVLRRQALFIGRDWVRKGGHVLLAAWRQVRRAVPDARLVMVGPEEDLSDARAGIASYPTLPPDRIAALFGESTVFVLPTLWEPYGVVFLEALACGVPVIGPRRMAVPEIIDHGRSGYLIDTDDPEMYAERLIEMLTRPELTLDMSRRAFRSAAQFSWPAVQERMASVLEPWLGESVSHRA